MNSMFNIFQYLQMKGIDGEQQKNYFKELDEANDKNSVLQFTFGYKFAL